MQQIPMSSPDLTHAEIAAVNEVLTSPCLSIGQQIESFERAFASYIGRPYAVGVNSGTSGLHLAVIAAGAGDGDLVITTPFSFIASANCILYERGIPVFVDVDPRTGNIDCAQVAEAVEGLARGGRQATRRLPPEMRNGPVEARKVKAILPVHAFGQPVDMDPLLEIAEKYQLAVIEDACEAIGAEYKGRRAGALGHAAVFAFYPNKQMTTGEGGMIVTGDESWASLFRSMRNQGRDVFNSWLNHTRLGYNYRLDEMSAAMGLAQLKRIESLLLKREQVASWYRERLPGIELIETPTLAPTTTRMSWFVYVIRIRQPANRDVVIQQLEAAGIPSRPYFTPIHLQPFYAKKFGYRPGDFPVAERLGDSSLALPFSGILSESQVDYICQTLSRILKQSVKSSRAHTDQTRHAIPG
jgi:dTDP-4-amino-4,6-dideoxygalactose transaminase